MGEARVEDGGRTVVWNVNAAAGSQHGMVVYTRPDFALKCAEELLNRAVASTERAQGGRFSVYSNAAHLRLACKDLGDAPDSRNHAGQVMEAYPGVIAHFPTVFDPALGSPQGPRHNFAWQDAWLGTWVSSERDADQAQDVLILPNLAPSTGRFN
ncbi:MAG TPA: hypothetical protein EYP77_11815 [Anaerolineae bacterium]|nr:hypothetical protein [Anaerolineae bacterium]